VSKDKKQPTAVRSVGINSGGAPSTPIGGIVDDPKVAGEQLKRKGGERSSRVGRIRLDK